MPIGIPDKDKIIGRGKPSLDRVFAQYISNVTVRTRAKEKRELEDATLPPSAMEDLGLMEELGLEDL